MSVRTEPYVLSECHRFMYTWRILVSLEWIFCTYDTIISSVVSVHNPQAYTCNLMGAVSVYVSKCSITICNPYTSLCWLSLGLLAWITKYPTGWLLRKKKRRSTYSDVFHMKLEICIVLYSCVSIAVYVSNVKIFSFGLCCKFQSVWINK